MGMRPEFGFMSRKILQNICPRSVHACIRCNCCNSNESFLSGHSSQYIEDMYEAWAADPKSVHTSWDSYFRNANYQPPPNLAPPGKNEVPLGNIMPKSGEHSGSVEDSLMMQKIITDFRMRGHLVAKLDPLELKVPDCSTLLSKYKLNDDILSKEYKLPPGVYIGGGEEKLTLKEIIERLKQSYCTHIGTEFMYIIDDEERDWIKKQIETPGRHQLTTEEKRLVFDRLVESAGLEMFCMKKWPTEKRFGLEGGDMMIPCLKTIIDRSSELGVENFIIGMPHRGRLNVLVNVCRRPFFDVIAQFKTITPEDPGCGDVKYHLGTYIEMLNTVTNKTIRMSLLANPSHLEIVNAMVLGRAKAEQFFRGDCDGKKTLAIILHGDAANAGEGIVYESINIGSLPFFTPHGTVHVVVNNQIGFTSFPHTYSSSVYCTDVSKIVNSPILHVNCDQPESVIKVSRIAAEYRASFRKDVVLDLICYRRLGHNETDEPMLTQPIMYAKIKKTLPILEKFAQRLVQDGILKEEEVKQKKEQYDKYCEGEFEKGMKETKMRYRDWIDSPWTGFFSGRKNARMEETGLPEKTILHILDKFSSHPHNSSDFIVHKAIERILKVRRELLEKRMFDWGMGEAIAFGSLLKDGIHVRLSGQDVERGTFSHRHHVLHHQTADNTSYNSLNHLYPDQAYYSVCNSPVIEYGVLCFELGYSMSNPRALVVFEGQFGDFVNNAQAIIDTVISCGEAKWGRQSGLVMLLPHGLEGAGPEHSSARLERYLQLSADDPDVYPPECDDYELKQLQSVNWFVANCTTPANLVHILRRQICLPFRKPLILMTPKILLRHPEARSSFDDILPCTNFKRLIPDDGPASETPDCVKKLIFCSGKVYYDIKKVLKEKGLEAQIAVSRIEQLTPFPFDLVRKEACKYSKAKIVWCQEEHKNQGAWQYVFPRIETALEKTKEVHYVGRPVSESTAAGLKAIHTREVAKLFEDVCKLDDDKKKC